MTSDEKKETLPQPDWVIGDLYNKAWQIVKKNKILWIFGAAISASSYSANGNFNGLRDLLKPFKDDPEKAQKMASVLGESTTRNSEIISHFLLSVPSYLWTILAIEVIILILASIVFTATYKSWATGALLINIEENIKGAKATIREASEKSFTLLKPLIWLDVIPKLIMTIITIGAAFIILIGIFNSPSQIMPVLIFLFFFLIVILVYAWIMLSTSLIWATRKLVTEKISAKKALSIGYKIAKKKFWATILLGFVNNILAILVIGAPFALILGIAIGSLFIGKYSELLLVIIFVLIFIFVIIALIIGGIINAFKATVWSLAYNKIKSKYETS